MAICNFEKIFFDIKKLFFLKFSYGSILVRRFVIDLFDQNFKIIILKKWRGHPTSTMNFVWELCGVLVRKEATSRGSATSRSIATTATATAWVSNSRADLLFR